jgi:hypothetical protein
MTKVYLLAGCALVLVACGNTGNGSGDVAISPDDALAAIGLEPGGTAGFYQQVPLQSYSIDAATPTVIAHRDGGDFAPKE